MKSWKTSIAGAVVILAAIVGMAVGQINGPTGSALIFVGIALVLAKDHDAKDDPMPPASPPGTP